MIKVICSNCGLELTVTGGLVFSPPNDLNVVEKFHYCIVCYPKIKQNAEIVKRLDEEIKSKKSVIDQLKPFDNVMYYSEFQLRKLLESIKGEK